MNAFEVNALKPALIFTDHLILDKQFLVLGKGYPVTQELIKELGALPLFPAKERLTTARRTRT